jgi:hypothetical protein
MNERIKLLAEQAKGFVDLNQHVGGDNGCMIYTYEGLNKFAELIVKECANAIVNDSRLNDVRSAANGCVRTIKQHFGVEE